MPRALGDAGNNGLRARMVCDECHIRKVRCDLEKSSTGKCSHCRRLNHECRRRANVRKRTRTMPPSASPKATPPSQLHSNWPVSPTPSTERQAGDCASSNARSERGVASPVAYMGDGSLLSWPRDELPTHNRTTQLFSTAFRGVLEATKAEELPSATQLQASVDFYHKYLYCALPILDRSELQDPDALVGQTAHFLGCLLRSPDKTTNLALQTAYEKIRILLFARSGSDKLAVLSALVALSCWSPNPPDVVTLDVSWHWIGSAVRYALQIGLHRENTYQHGDATSRSRRLWWSAFNTEVIHGASYGRPIMCRPQDADIKLPTLADFETPDLSARLFIANTSLCLIISDIHELSLRRHDVPDQEMAVILGSFRSWLDHLPSEVRLYDRDVRRPYDFAVSQLHLLYLTAVIACLLLPGKHRHCRIWSTVSFVASGCIARLYDEIQCHEDVHRMLPHNGWIITVASIPLIYSVASFPSETSSSAQDLNLLTTIISQLAEKHASARMVLRKITAFRTKMKSHPVLASPGKEQDTACDVSQPPQAELEKAAFNDAKSLLPFPEGHCHSMRFLRCGADGHQIDQLSDAAPFEFNETDIDMDWSILFNSFATEPNALGTIPEPVDFATLLDN